MRRIILAIAAAAVIGTGLAATAPAKADWYYGGGYHHNDWRAREWREHQEWGGAATTGTSGRNSTATLGSPAPTAIAERADCRVRASGEIRGPL